MAEEPDSQSEKKEVIRKLGLDRSIDSPRFQKAYLAYSTAWNRASSQETRNKLNEIMSSLSSREISYFSFYKKLYACAKRQYALTWLWRIMFLASVFFAVVSFNVTWPAVRANFLGGYSICPFVPFSVVVLFALSVALYAYASRHRKILYGSVLIILTIFGFTGWWFYSFKLPMEDLHFSMAMSYFYVGTTNYSFNGLQNLSSTSFYLTIRNPTGRDTPQFLIQPRYIAINNKKLTAGFQVGSRNGTRSWPSDGRESMFYQPTVLKSHENLTLLIECLLTYNYLEVEGASREQIWSWLNQGNFTFAMSGILTVRPYYTFTYGEGKPTSFEDTSTWAAKPFTVSQRYS